MKTFVAVDDQLLAQRIAAACSRVVFIAPAVSQIVATALMGCSRKARAISVSIVLDPDDEAYRIGYGDRDGLRQLQQLAKDNKGTLRSQPGLRIGLLLVDKDVLVWSPTPRAVEGQPDADEPNGVDLIGGISKAGLSAPLDGNSSNLVNNQEPSTSPGCLADMIQNAVGSNWLYSLPSVNPPEPSTERP